MENEHRAQTIANRPHDVNRSRSERHVNPGQRRGRAELDSIRRCPAAGAAILATRRTTI